MKVIQLLQANPGYFALFLQDDGSYNECAIHFFGLTNDGEIVSFSESAPGEFLVDADQSAANFEGIKYTPATIRGV